MFVLLLKEIYLQKIRTAGYLSLKLTLELPMGLIVIQTKEKMKKPFVCRSKNYSKLAETITHAFASCFLTFFTYYTISKKPRLESKTKRNNSQGHRSNSPGVEPRFKISSNRIRIILCVSKKSFSCPSCSCTVTVNQNYTVTVEDSKIRQYDSFYFLQFYFN